MVSDSPLLRFSLSSRPAQKKRRALCADEGSLPPFAPPLEFFQRVWGELLREKTPNPNKNPIANAATNQTPVATGWLLISGPNSNPRCACGGSDAFTDSDARRAASQTNTAIHTGSDAATAAIPQQTPRKILAGM